MGRLVQINFLVLLFFGSLHSYAKPLSCENELQGPGNEVFAYSIKQLPYGLLRLAKKLKRLTRSHEPAREREMGGLYVEYYDGSHKVIRFTSNRVDEILGEDFTKAVWQSQIFRDWNQIKAIAHLHTHPKEGPLSFSQYDLNSLSYFRAEIARFSGREIPVIGIVLPNCEQCSDLAFVIARFD